MPKVKEHGSDAESDDDYHQDEDYNDNGLDLLANVSAEENEDQPRKKTKLTSGAAKARAAPKDVDGLIPCPNTPCTSTFARRNALSRHLRMSCKYGPQGELIGRIPCPVGSCSWWGRPDNLPAHQIAKHGEDEGTVKRNTKPKAKKRPRESEPEEAAPQIPLPPQVDAGTYENPGGYDGGHIDPSLGLSQEMGGQHGGVGDGSVQIPEGLILEALSSLDHQSGDPVSHQQGDIPTTMAMDSQGDDLKVQEHDLGSISTAADHHPVFAAVPSMHHEGHYEGSSEA